MPFENGNINSTFFYYKNNLPENYIESFASRRAGSLDNATDEPQFGWVSGRHLLDNNIVEENVLRGEFCHLCLRKAERKIPSSYLNALCSQEEYIYLKANNLDFVSKKIKREIKEDIIEKNLMKMPPSLSSIPFVIAPIEKLIFVGATSQAQLDLFIEYFIKATDMEPIPFTPGIILSEDFNTTESAVPKLQIAVDVDDDPNIGRDFLTWLWYYSETSGLVSDEQFGEFDIFIEGPLTFAFSADSRGAAETVIKNGDSPQRSAEAKAALLIGKKLKKAKFSISRQNEIFSGNFDADNFAVGSLKLPETDAQDDDGRFEERMQNMVVFKRALHCYFKKYVECMLAPDFAEYQKKMQLWALERDGI